MGAEQAAKLKRRLYKPKEAEYILNIGHTKLYQLVASGQLRIVKIGRSSYIDERSIDDFIMELHGTVA